MKNLFTHISSRKTLGAKPQRGFTSTSEKQIASSRAVCSSAVEGKLQKGFTPTSEGQSARVRAFFPNAVVAKPQRGFTLIETLVAITVLLLAVAAPITYAAKGIQNTYYARDQIVAFYLAQEGIELMRAERDDNALANNPPGTTNWITGLSGCTTSNGCGIDARSRTIVACTASADSCRMYYDPAGLTGSRGIYVMPGVSNTTATTYVRRIRVIDDASNSYERLLESEVTWTTGAVTKTITVRSKIFNQYDELFQ